MSIATDTSLLELPNLHLATRFISNYFIMLNSHIGSICVVIKSHRESIVESCKQRNRS